MDKKEEGIIKENDRRLERYKRFICFGTSTYFNPINFIKEKERFFKEKNYQPQFKYKKILKSDLEKARKEVLEIKGGSSPLLEAYSRKRKELLLFLDALDSLGKKESLDYTEEIYKTPPKKLSDKSFVEALQKTQKTKKGKKITTEKAKEKIEKIFIQNSLPWKVVLLERTLSRGVISPRKQQLLLKKGVSFRDRDDLLGFIAHEVFSHIFRYENGKKQPYGIFKHGFANYIISEEGLATYNKIQVLSKEAGNGLRKALALRIIAAKLAMEKSFFDSFSALLEITRKPRLSFGIIARAKRGLRDTSQKGAFLKDTAYYRGLFEVEDFLENRGELKDLYFGKTTVDCFKLIKRLENLKKPQVPNFSSLQEVREGL